MSYVDLRLLFHWMKIIKVRFIPDLRVLSQGSNRSHRSRWDYLKGIWNRRLEEEFGCKGQLWNLPFQHPFSLLWRTTCYFLWRAPPFQYPSVQLVHVEMAPHSGPRTGHTTQTQSVRALHLPVTMVDSSRSAWLTGPRRHHSRSSATTLWEKGLYVCWSCYTGGTMNRELILAN